MEANDEFGSTTFNTKTGIDYFNKVTLESDSLLECDIDETIEIAQAFKEECAPFADKRGFYTCQRNLVDEYDLEELYFQAEYNTVKESLKDTVINSAFRELVKAWVKPVPKGDEYIYTSNVDCKILTLFKDGKIDWKTVRVLTYSDCDL